MSTEIRVALVFEQDEGTQALRTALGNAGVVVALECRASNLVTSRILETAVDAIVVNLDSELENLLDEVTEALDAATQPVIYNDPAASSDLSGWDRARWTRHLSAKLKGQSNVTPPPPPGAKPIPMPVVRAPEFPVAATVAAALPAQSAPVAPIASADEDAVRGVDVADRGVAESSADEIPFDLGLADLDLMFDESADARPSQPVAPSTSFTMGDDIGDLDALFAEAPAVDFEAKPVAVAPVVEPANPPEDAEIDLDSLFVESSGVEFDSETGTEANPDANSLDSLAGSELDLDALFAEEPVAAMAPPVPVATESELTDLDALFREFESSQSEESLKPAADHGPRVEPSSAAAPPRGAPAAWLLEPLDELSLDDVQSGGESAAPQASAAPVARAPAKPTIPAELEASLALSDLKLLDDIEPPQPSASSTSVIADLDSIDFSGMGLEPIEPAAQAPAPVDLGEELSLADFDFDLGSDSVEAPAQGGTASLSGNDADLGDLDSLFEPTAEPSLLGLSLPDLDRVFVLGASIGGPEAIKLFLSRLPSSVPAAFIVAQHMGSEFLEMMAVQLDSASQLPVRCPKAGERLRHGEVIVAPANEQLSIDDSGHVQLSAAASGSPYNPSIDHLARAAADRFGDHATLILFSGMGSDAVEGGRYLTSRGGQVWAQDRATCVIASMIDSAKSQGLVRFEGSPVQLADRVLQLLS